MKNPTRNSIFSQFSDFRHAAKTAPLRDAKTGSYLSLDQLKVLVSKNTKLTGIVTLEGVDVQELFDIFTEVDANADKDKIDMTKTMCLAFGFTEAEAQKMADEIVAGADVKEVTKRYAKRNPVIQSVGGVEFKTAAEAASYVAGLTKDGKKAFYAALKVAMKVQNGDDEEIMSLAELFKKASPVAIDDSDDTDDTDADAATTDLESTDRALILVQDGDTKDDTKVFAAKVALYSDADTINALLEGTATKVKAITKVAGVKVVNEDTFTVAKYLRHKNEISKKFSLMDKRKKDSKSKKGKDKDDDDED